MSYAIGDVEFDKKGQAYMWPILIEEVLETLVQARYNSHNSYPNVIYKVDRNDIKSLILTSGMASGRAFPMCRIIDEMGNYYEL